MKLLSLAFLFLIFSVLAPYSVSAKALPSQSLLSATQVSATVPGYWWLELVGWTSPFAQVELNLQDILKRVTWANDEGEFNFKLTLPRELAPFCLIATDITNASSHPLCIAPPPPQLDILVKEVVMPPTLILKKGKMAKNETVAAQGYTTPNSEVVPYLFEEKPRFFFFWPKSPFTIYHLPSIAFATEIPKPIIKSDNNGFYQFNLPTSDIGKKRLFIGSLFLKNPSPKSTTLTFDVWSWWRLLLNYLFALLIFLLGLLATLEWFILAEIAFALTIVYFLVRKKGKSPEFTERKSPSPAV